MVPVLIELFFNNYKQVLSPLVVGLLNFTNYSNTPTLAKLKILPKYFCILVAATITKASNLEPVADFLEYFMSCAAVTLTLDP